MWPIVYHHRAIKQARQHCFIRPSEVIAIFKVLRTRNPLRNIPQVLFYIRLFLFQLSNLGLMEVNFSFFGAKSLTILRNSRLR